MDRSARELAARGLRALLAELYDNPGLVTLAADCGIERNQFAQHPKSNDTSTELVREARARGRLMSLARLAQQDYPEHDVLARVIAALEASDTPPPQVGEASRMIGDHSFPNAPWVGALADARPNNTESSLASAAEYSGLRLELREPFLAERRRVLSYQCDRVFQRQDLQRVLLAKAQPSQIASSLSAPVCLIHGAPEQEPDRFAGWLADGLLQDLNAGQAVTELKVRWPINMQHDEEFFQFLTLNLAEAAQAPHLNSREAVAALLSRWPEDYYLSIQLPLSYWSEGERARLGALCRYFQNWGAAGRRPLFILLWITYREPDTRRFSWLRPDPNSATNRAVRRSVEQLSESGSARLITELSDAREDDVMEWVGRPQIRQMLGHRDPHTAVREIFGGRGGLPMRMLAKKLEAMLTASQTEG